METYAIIKNGGKQYAAQVGDILTLERIEKEKGSALQLNDVMLVVSEDKPTFGAPFVKDAYLDCSIVDQGRMKKVLIQKHKRRHQYDKRTGHRQYFTKVFVKNIVFGGKKLAAADAEFKLKSAVVAAETAPVKKTAKPKAEKVSKPKKVAAKKTTTATTSKKAKKA